MRCSGILCWRREQSSTAQGGPLETVGGGVTRKRRCICSGKGNPVLLSWLDLGHYTSEKEKDPGYPYGWGWKGKSYEAGCDPLALRSSRGFQGRKEVGAN